MQEEGAEGKGSQVKLKCSLKMTFIHRDSFQWEPVL